MRSSLPVIPLASVALFGLSLVGMLASNPAVQCGGCLALAVVVLLAWRRGGRR